ncbi:MAG TPA: cadmium-translocating P-type ATPase [Acholeplasmataceae bacterium]|jgi:Cd2+/Zn2+-exporting ATPase|nr:cadmium-translocating P-type ATPase [Acholeplasmataceae bacterium]
MKCFRKQYYLKNVASSSIIRKIEFDISRVFKNGAIKINPDNNVMMVEFKNCESIEEDIALIMETIKKVDDDIIIEEKEIKPTYRKVLLLENLDCANCAAKIERIAKRTFDHEMIVVDFASTRFIIETSDKELVENLLERVQAIARSVDVDIKVSEFTKNKPVFERGIKIDKGRKTYFIVGFAIFLFGFILKTVLRRFEIKEYLIYTIIYVTYVTGYILLAGDILYGAFKNIQSGRIFDEKFLMSMATIIAFAVGYYDEAVFIMIFYRIGELCQQYAVNYSRRSIAKLIDIQPQKAALYMNDEIVEVDPAEIVVGDVIFVRPGERIPLDGVIIEGEGTLDVSALTGESIHRDVSVDDEVFSGAINVDGNLSIRVTRPYKDSMVAKILNLVENASSLKSKSENFISKFARYYTPTIVALAFIIAITLPFINPSLSLGWENGFKHSIKIALIFLVVSCPCALVISIPLGFFGGIGGASRQGILVKGSNYLETLNAVEYFVFDKTGTLTNGHFTLDKIVTFGAYDEDKILELAAHAEFNSTHPIAKAIIDAYGADNVSVQRIKFQRFAVGTGVNNKVDHYDVHVGRAEYLRENGIAVTEIMAAGNRVYVAINSKVEGCLIIKDNIKENAATAIAALRDVGIKRTFMLTGDSELIAEDVSAQVGIDEYYANMTPIDKVDKVLELKHELSKSGEKIAYVGDGINDAPVLSSADVGIAMGGLGSDAAIEVADIVLMTDDLSKLATAKRIAKKTRRIVIQNICLALIVKATVLLLALLEPFINDSVFAFILDFLIYEALFADVGVSLIAILNSLRAMRLNKNNLRG